MHGGFYKGARRHLEEVVEAVASHSKATSPPGRTSQSSTRRGTAPGGPSSPSQTSSSRRTRPRRSSEGSDSGGPGPSGDSAAEAPAKAVWVTGHSLGGAYASCVLLHLLASRGTAQLFGKGAPVSRSGHARLLSRDNYMTALLWQCFKAHVGFAEGLCICCHAIDMGGIGWARA